MSAAAIFKAALAVLVLLAGAALVVIGFYEGSKTICALSYCGLPGLFIAIAATFFGGVAVIGLAAAVMWALAHVESVIKDWSRL